MNEIFNFQRFINLIRLDLAEKGKSYILMALLLVTLMLACMLPIAMYQFHNELLLILHALALFMVVMFGGSLYTAQTFNQYNSPLTGIPALMVPASTLEKFLGTLLINLAFMAPFTWLFIKGHFFLVDYANEKLVAGASKYQPIPVEILKYFIFLHCVMQGVVFLGSIYFSKLSYLKCAVVFFATFGGLFWFNNALAYAYSGSPNKVVAFPFSAWKLWFDNFNKSVYIAFPEPYQTAMYIFPIFLLFSFWVIALQRFREKQI